MQFVNTPHQRQIGDANQSGQIVNGASADFQNLRLSDHGQGVFPVDHRFALGKSPAFPSTPD